MKDNFQIIVIIVFLIAAVLGVLVFSGAIPLGEDGAPGAQGTVTLWGTIDESAVGPVLEIFNAENPSYIVKYAKRQPETFDQDLLEAIASGKGPDMIILPDDLAFKYRNKVLVIPYQSYPISNFKNSFVGAGEVFLTSAGILAFPVYVDPMVMYYNRSILDANSVVFPPKDWEEFASLVSALTKRDDSNKIIKSGAALGHFSNVTHAKDIISMLFMQAGSPIVSEQADGTMVSRLLNYESKYDLESPLRFYARFANPLDPAYSWNKSLPSSTDAFSKEDLAFYFGYASELMQLVNRNPNQNFMAAPVPQFKGEDSKLTKARVYGVAVLASSRNLDTAFVAAESLSGGNFAKKLSAKLSAVPARRDLIVDVPNDSYSPVFYNSALYARSWLDPSPKDTDNIFKAMIEGVLSNSLTVGQALTEAGSKISLLLLK